VDAIDRNDRSLEVARNGRYSLKALRDDIPSWSRRWLYERHGQLHVASQIRQAVHFVRADILAGTGWFAGPYAVVFCRNLLIYLHAEARRQLVDGLSIWVEQNGLMFVGHAEHLEILRPYFDPLPDVGAFGLRRRAGDQSLLVERPQSPAPHAISATKRTALRPARPSLRQASTPASDSLPVVDLYRQARDLADRGQLDAARDKAQSALQHDGPTTQLYHLLANLELARGQLGSAREALLRAVYLEPEHEESLLQLAILSQQLGDELAAEHYRKRAARVRRRNQAE
jgi:chemotaxis protein methyltransferase WspC